MKKIFALLLALCLLCSVTAFADEAAPAFSVNMDAIPEGYTLNQETVGSDLVLLFIPTNPEQPIYYGSVAFSELFDGYTLDIAALSEEEKAQVAEMFAGDFNNPVLDFSCKTAHGTDVIVLSESGDETDCIEVVTIWQGFFITVGVYAAEAVPADAAETVIKLMSDLWVEVQ